MSEDSKWDVVTIKIIGHGPGIRKEMEAHLEMTGFIVLSIKDSIATEEEVRASEGLEHYL